MGRVWEKGKDGERVVNDDSRAWERGNNEGFPYNGNEMPHQLAVHFKMA